MRATTFVSAAALALGGCSSPTVAIDTAAECADSFRSAATRAGSDLVLPNVDETAAAGFQDAADWEGRTPVCWVSYSGDRGCRVFMLDLEGTWAAPEWVDTGTDPQPCVAEGKSRTFEIAAP